MNKLDEIFLNQELVRLIPVSIAILLAVYGNYSGITEIERNIRIVYNCAILLVLFWIIVKVKFSVQNMIMVTTLILPLTFFLRSFEVLIVSRWYFEGLLFYNILDLMDFLTLFLMILGVVLAVVDRMKLHRLGYRRIILPLFLPSTAVILLFPDLLEIKGVPTLVSSYIIPILYVLVGPHFIERVLGEGVFDHRGVEDVFFAIFGLNIFSMSFVVARVSREVFSSWGPLDFIPMEIILSSLLFPWAFLWAVEMRLERKHLKAVYSLLAFYGLSFLSVAFSFIFYRWGYPVWALEVPAELPIGLSVFLYALYSILIPTLMLRGSKGGVYLFSIFIFFLPIITKYFISKIVAGFITGFLANDAIAGFISGVSLAAAFKLIQKRLKRE